MKQKLFSASLTLACLLTINCSVEAATTKQKILEQTQVAPPKQVTTQQVVQKTQSSAQPKTTVVQKPQPVIKKHSLKDEIDDKLSKPKAQASPAVKVESQTKTVVTSKPQASPAVKVEPQPKPVVVANSKANSAVVAKPQASAKPQVNSAVVTKTQVTAKPKVEAKQIDKPLAKPQAKTSTAPSGKTFYRGQEIPANWKDISLTGEPVATKHQALTYLVRTNPKAKLDCSPEEIVNVYWVEATKENIRPDLAFCQAIVETGFFKYGGDVLPSQNNFCGLGTVGGGAKGVRFKTPAEGARAHIQHLLAYSRVELPKTKIIDPRYKLVHGIRMERGLIHKWSGLNGTWAMGGNYCEKIMTHYQNMLKLPVGSKSQNKIDTKKKIQDKSPRKMREKAWNHIETK